MINTRVIQLQLLRNQPSFNVKFNNNIKTIDRSPQGNSRKEDGFPSFDVGMVKSLKKDREK